MSNMSATPSQTIPNAIICHMLSIHDTPSNKIVEPHVAIPIHASVSGDAGPLWKEDLCDPEDGDPLLCRFIPYRRGYCK